LVTRELGRSLARFKIEDLGRTRRVIVERDSTTLIEGGGDPAPIRREIDQIEKALGQSGADYDRDALRRRLGILRGGIAVIRVGASTELELAERKSRFDDALAATR